MALLHGSALVRQARLGHPLQALGQPRRGPLTMRLPKVVAVLSFLLGALALSCEHRVFHHQPGEPRSTLRLRFVQEDSDGPLISKKTGTRFTALTDSVVTEEDIRRVASDPLRSGGCDIQITFTRDAAERLASFTHGRTGQLLAVIIDEDVVSAPRLLGELTPTIQLRADFSCDEAADIASKIAP